MATKVNLELLKLQWVHNQIKPMIGEGESLEKAQKYRALVRKLPSMILTNGILNTLFFLKGKAKNGNEHEVLLKHLIAWSDNPMALVPKLENATWASTMLEKSSPEIRIIAKDYLNLSGYIKRVAEVIIPEKVKNPVKTSNNA